MVLSSPVAPDLYSGGVVDRDEEARSIAFLGREFSKVLKWAIARISAKIDLKSPNPQKISTNLW
ncbi:hypothetical protein [Microcoleus sp. MON2_D5]|uniref:hypothetical protein n=1 Tax=Microcoleus sp. MON2_D5 TaxID=2818833 RepID=UPI002FD53D06